MVGSEFLVPSNFTYFHENYMYFFLFRYEHFSERHSFGCHWKICLKGKNLIPQGVSYKMDLDFCDIFARITPSYSSIS